MCRKNVRVVADFICDCSQDESVRREFFVRLDFIPIPVFRTSWHKESGLGWIYSKNSEKYFKNVFSVL